MTAPKPEDVEVILRDQFPLGQVAATLVQSLAPEGAANAFGDLSGIVAAASPQVEKVEAMRRQLLALPADEVARRAADVRRKRAAAAAASHAKRSKADQDRAEAKERARFFNQPAAMADFGFWAKAECWTMDDALALLLGRDPRVVTPEAMQKELAPGFVAMNFDSPPPRSAFHEEWDSLRLLIERSEFRTASHMRPADVVAWAQRTGAANVPPGLLAALPAAGPTPTVTTTPTATPESSPASAGKREKGARWSPAELEALRAFKTAQGTLAAALEFGITAARVRKLVPAAPIATGPAAKLDDWPPRPRPKPTR